MLASCFIERLRPESSSFLAGAARSYGGDYPNRAVHERLTMFKFAATILLLVPVNLSRRTPNPYDNLHFSVSIHTTEVNFQSAKKTSLYKKGK